MPRLLSNYDVSVDLDEKGQLKGIQLIVVETEGVTNA